MNREINELLRASEGRYLTKAEQSTLRDFASKLDARLRAMEEISVKEKAIVERAIREVMSAYPDFEKKHVDGQAKGSRDLALVLRYATQALVRGDAQYFEEALLVWFQTILKGIGFQTTFIEDTYRALERAAAEELSESTMALLRPFISQATKTLSQRRQVAA